MSGTQQLGSKELGSKLSSDLGPDAVLGTTGGGSWACACVDVPPARWREAVGLARTRHGLEFFDWLGGAAAVPSAAEPAAGDQAAQTNLHVIVHLWSIPARAGVLLRTTVSATGPADAPTDLPSVPSIVDIFPGADWYERETFEMFGIEFPGHPNLRKLLLTEEFDGNPLRKEFVLASRVVKAWPGEKDPGDGAPKDGAAGRPRRRMLPPGVPEPGTWPAPQASNPEPVGE